MGRSVRVLLRNGDEKTFDNAEYQVNFHARLLTVYHKEEDEEGSPEPPHGASDATERQELARFNMDTVRFYEYFIDA